LSQLLSKLLHPISCSFYIKPSMCLPCCWTTHFRLYNVLLQKSSCFRLFLRHLRCGEIFSNSTIINFSPDSGSEKMKIGQYI